MRQQVHSIIIYYQRNQLMKSQSRLLLQLPWCPLSLQWLWLYIWLKITYYTLHIPCNRHPVHDNSLVFFQYYVTSAAHQRNLRSLQPINFAPSYVVLNSYSILYNRALLCFERRNSFCGVNSSIILPRLQARMRNELLQTTLVSFWWTDKLESSASLSN